MSVTCESCIIGNNVLNYIPCTLITNTNFSDIVTAVTTAPTCSTTVANRNFKYSYQVIGKTIYYNYTYHAISIGTQGSGNYLYKILDNFVPDITLIEPVAAIAGHDYYGSIIGNSRMHAWSIAIGFGACHLTKIGTKYYIIITNSGNEQQRNNMYEYSLSKLSITFNCSFPFV